MFILKQVEDLWIKYEKHETKEVHLNVCILLNLYLNVGNFSIFI